VPSYLIETYLSRTHVGERSLREQRAQSAADEMTRQGQPVTFAHSIHVPEDELCFFIFDARTGSDAAVVAERAGLDPIRVVEAVHADGGTRPRETQ